MRVLELGCGIAVSYASKLLADEGADVIKFESLEGDPLRRGNLDVESAPTTKNGLFLALNINKRGVSFDFTESRSLDRLLDWAELVILGVSNSEFLKLRLDAKSLLEDRPHLVVLSITPFGRYGPCSGYLAEELNLVNASGWANLCPSTHSDPSLPPLKPFGEQCSMMAAVSAAATGLAYLRKAQSVGVGELIDFSIQEYICSVLEVAIPVYSYKEQVVSRIYPRSLIPWKIFQAKDRPIFIACIEQDQWERLVDFMGNPEWASLEIFADQPSRAENQDMVHTFIQEFVDGWSADDLYHEAQKYRICVAPVLNFELIQKNDHLVSREFFERVDVPGFGQIKLMRGAVLKTSGRSGVRRLAPELGEHNVEIENLPRLERAAVSLDHSRPLEGVRVLDMTWAWAGPFCSMNLAHLGAEVVRIESEKRSDLYRRMPVFPDEWEPTLNNSGMFNQWNQGKSSISVDLSHADGLEVVRDLVKQSDVMVQNFATGVLERLGLGYDELKAINPRLILVSISGYGQTGPYREYMGYGPAIPPLAGLSEGTGYEGGPQEEIGLSMPDPTAGITGTLGVVSALFRRDQTGEGDHLDVTLWESTAVLNLSGWMNFIFEGVEPQRLGNRSLSMAPHGCYPCLGEDAWVSIACVGDVQWRGLAEVLGGELSSDPRFVTLAARKKNEDELDQIILAWSSIRDRWEITRLLQAKGVAAFPTMTTQDIVEDPHLSARDFIERRSHPEVGERAHTGIPWVTQNSESNVRSAAPCLGADTDGYLGDVLGYDEARIKELYQNGAIGV